jgi:hypothetical protein
MKLNLSKPQAVSDLYSMISSRLFSTVAFPTAVLNTAEFTTPANGPNWCLLSVINKVIMPFQIAPQIAKFRNDVHDTWLPLPVEAMKVTADKSNGRSIPSNG